MKLSMFALAAVGIVFLVSCGPTSTVAPVAEKRPHELEMHGDVRIDDYYWLRERTNPEVLAYLEAENAYSSAVMAKTEALQEKLFEELKNRIQPDESTVPALNDGYHYYKHYEEGLEYPIHCRRKGSVDAPEEIMLDVNRGRSDGHDFCSVRGVAKSVRTPGCWRGRWTPSAAASTRSSFKDLETGEPLADVISEVTEPPRMDQRQPHPLLRQAGSGNPCARTRSTGTCSEPIRQRMCWSMRKPIQPISVDVWKTRIQERYILIESEHTLASEVRFLDADRPEGEFQDHRAPRARCGVQRRSRG